MNPLRSLIERFVAWNRKPRYRSADEVAQLLQDVASGNAPDYKIDGFIYIPVSDPELDRIREEFGMMYGPGFDPTSSEFVALVAEAEKIAAQQPAPEKPSFSEGSNMLIRALRLARLALVVCLVLWAAPLLVTLTSGAAPDLLYVVGIYATYGIAISAAAEVGLHLATLLRSQKGN
jgi:hypothetical protein